MILLLPKERLFPFMEQLRSKIEVVAPLMSEGGPIFATWDGHQPLALDENTLDTPLEFLLPQREVLFRYVQFSGRYTFEEIPPKPRLIMGMKPCDLRAVKILDRIMGAKPQDHPYFSRRRSTILAVFNCITPGEGCFCAGMGSGPESNDDCDLLFTDIGPGYLVESKSPAGIMILQEHPEYFLKPTEDQMVEKARLLETAKDKMEQEQCRSPEQIRQAMETANWDALGRICLNCGGCTFVCPVCHCFNIVDLGVPDGERLRCRDSCTLSGFSKMFGGANPRKNQGERMHNWYLDKFEYIPEKTGLPGCVGCGRCSRVCLAEMNRWSLEPMV